MFDALNAHRLHYQEMLFDAISSYNYRFTRYNEIYSIVLVYISEECGDLLDYNDFLRETDTIICFRPNLCAIVFDETNIEQGIKAAENILTRLQVRFFSKHIYMTVITVSHEQSEFQTIHDLFDLMSYALIHNMDNLVIDTSQLIQHQQPL